MVNQCIDIITKLSRELGLTPAARSRIIAQAETDSTHDELAALLRAPREPRPKPTESVN
jgi:phage terminase small subunit